MKKILLLLSTLLYLTACSDPAPKAQTTQPTVRLVSSPGDFADMIREHIGPELEKRGFRYQLSETTNGILPNQAVIEGSAEANLFQHKPYLDEYNAQVKGDLVPLAQVPTAPLAIYRARLSSLEDVKEGSSIGIPNNVTNFARGLRILESLGWIELDPNANPITVSEKDIINNPKKVNIVAIDAAQVVRSRVDLDYAIINGNFAQDAKIPEDDILKTEPGKLFVNWIVVKDGQQNSDWAQALVEIVNSEDYKAYVKANFPAFYNLPPAWE